VFAQSVRVPWIWDDAALAEWATPVAGLNTRPSHFTAQEYYAHPADNLRTYPVYPPDKEPTGYWEWLQKQKPEPLVDVKKISSDADWIAAGERAFHDLGSVLVRTNDPTLIAQARDPAVFQGLRTLADGGVVGPRWVVTSEGVMLTVRACAACHKDMRAENRLRDGLPAVRPGLPLSGAAGTLTRLQRAYEGDPVGVAFWREFSVPWAPDERIERMKLMTLQELREMNRKSELGGAFSGGVFARTNGSPFYPTRILDLFDLKYSRYVDATGSHRLNGPEDVARYAALVTGNDRLDFGPHRMLTDAQRRVRFRYADEVLYAIGKYLLSLDPPKNPNPAPPDVVARGEQVFAREECGACHAPPNYTTGKLTLAHGWTPPANHPNRADIMMRSIGTDPGMALKTRKGTGFYKIPTLRGVWARRLLLHDGSLASLDELFNPTRLNPDYEPKGWNPPGITRRPVPGHLFGLALSDQDKAALLAFLRAL
jgi:hypothetical protein